MSNYLTCCCCPQGRGAFLFHGAKHPFMQATRASKIFKIIVIFTDSMSNYLTCCCCPQGRGALFISWCKAPLHASNVRLNKLKSCALLHDFLVCFLTCSCCPLGWVACIFHGAKHPFTQATRSRKIENLCSIAWFPCLFFDLLLLPCGLGGLYISWCEATLHASNAR